MIILASLVSRKPRLVAIGKQKGTYNNAFHECLSFIPLCLVGNNLFRTRDFMWFAQCQAQNLHENPPTAIATKPCHHRHGESSFHVPPIHKICSSFSLRLWPTAATERWAHVTPPMEGFFSNPLSLFFYWPAAEASLWFKESAYFD